jgi:hypothetical protein
MSTNSIKYSKGIWLRLTSPDISFPSTLMNEAGGKPNLQNAVDVMTIPYN